MVKLNKNLEMRDNNMLEKHCTYAVKNNINLPLVAYIPNSNKPKPAVVCIHGGAWSGRADNQAWDGDYIGAVAKHFATLGFVGVSIGYRNRDEKNTILDLYEDCLLAVRYIVENAGDLGIDKNKIIILGDSAGGHLALCLATKNDFSPYMTIACNPITDMLDPKWLVYVENQNQQIAHSLSPLYHVNNLKSKTVLLHGDADEIVDISHSIRFYELANKELCSLEIIPNANHAFILPGYYKDKEITEKAIAIIEKIICV
jgi:acetyl esterase/lipase